MCTIYECNCFGIILQMARLELNCKEQKQWVHLRIDHWVNRTGCGSLILVSSFSSIGVPQSEKRNITKVVAILSMLYMFVMNFKFMSACCVNCRNLINIKRKHNFFFLKKKHWLVFLSCVVVIQKFSKAFKLECAVIWCN